MNKLYEQLADLIKEKVFEQARSIYETYGRQASHIYGSYRSVIMEIASELEDTIGVPQEVIESIVETEGLTAKVGAIALFSHVKDEDDE